MTEETIKFTLNMLTDEEGYREKPYKDTKGIWTWGIGWNIEANPPTQKEWIEYTLLDSPQRKEWFIKKKNEQVKLYITQAQKNIIGFDKLPEKAQSVLVQMIFQMGIAGVTKFKNTLKHMTDGNWNKAATEMLNSSWATETPGRAKRMSEIIKNI